MSLAPDEIEPLMAEPDLMITFASDVAVVTYVPEDDVIICPLAMLFRQIDYDAIRWAVAERWRLS